MEAGGGERGQEGRMMRQGGKGTGEGTAGGGEEGRDTSEEEEGSGDSMGEGEGKENGCDLCTHAPLSWNCYPLPPIPSSPSHRRNSEKRQIGMSYLRTLA